MRRTAIHLDDVADREHLAWAFWRASLGKRTAGLVVSRQSGGRLSFGRALLRNAIKFVPWVAGHTVAQQAAFAGDGGFAAWVWGPAVLAVVVPLWWLVTLVAMGRTPYDRWVGARVVRSVADERCPSSSP